MSVLTDKADELAERGHAGQTRRYHHAPYIVHPRAVLKRLDAWGVDDDVVLASALAHDLLEDTSISEGEVANHLGREVVEVVREVSQPAGMSKQEWLRELAKSASARAVLLKAADRIENTLDFQRSGQLTKALSYLHEADEVFHRLRSESGKLGSSVVRAALKDFEEVHRELDMKTGHGMMSSELLRVARELLGVTIRCLGYEASEFGDGSVRFQIGDAVWRYDMVGEDAVTAYKMSRYSPGRALVWAKKHKYKETRERVGSEQRWDTDYMVQRGGEQGWEWPEEGEELVSEITHCQHSCVP